MRLFEFRIKKLAEKQTSNTESESFTALVSHFQRECLTRWKPNLLVILEKLCDVAIFSISYELESQFLKLCRYLHKRLFQKDRGLLQYFLSLHVFCQKLTNHKKFPKRPFQVLQYILIFWSNMWAKYH